MGAGLGQRVLVGGIAAREFSADRGGVGPGGQLRFRDGADLADLTRDRGGDRNLLPDPGRHLAGGVFDRADLDSSLLVVDLGDPPHLAALDEHRAGLGEIDDEPLVQGPDLAPRGDVVDLVGLLVGDHREVCVDVLPGAAGGLDAVLALVEPQDTVTIEFSDDLADRRFGHVPERIRPCDGLDGLVDGGVPATLDDRRQLIRHHVQTASWIAAGSTSPSRARRAIDSASNVSSGRVVTIVPLETAS